MREVNTNVHLTVIDALLREINSNETIFTSLFITELKKMEPVLQQSFVRSMVKVIIGLKDSYIDDRNLASITLARMLHAQNHVFPMIK